MARHPVQRGRVSGLGAAACGGGGVFFLLFFSPTLSLPPTHPLPHPPTHLLTHTPTPTHSPSALYPRQPPSLYHPTPPLPLAPEERISQDNHHPNTVNLSSGSPLFIQITSAGGDEYPPRCDNRWGGGPAISPV